MWKASESADKAAGELVNASGHLSRAARFFREEEDGDAMTEVVKARGRIVKAEKILAELAENSAEPPKPKPEPVTTGCFLDSMVLMALCIGWVILVLTALT